MYFINIFDVEKKEDLKKLLSVSHLFRLAHLSWDLVPWKLRFK
jgi:hypothetical protein